MADCRLRPLAALYAIDALDVRERARFERHLAHCDECRAEVGSHAASVLALASANGTASPPSTLKPRLLAAIAAPRPAEEGASKWVGVDRRRKRKSSFQEPGRIFEALQRRSSLQRVLGLSLVVACLLALALAIAFQRPPASSSLQALLGEPVKAESSFSSGHGQLLVGADGRAVLEVSFKRAPVNQTYQLWLEPQGSLAQARPAGLFPGAAKALLVLKAQVKNGDVVAITLEPIEGSKRLTSLPLATAPV